MCMLLQAWAASKAVLEKDDSGYRSAGQAGVDEKTIKFT